jgi:hypothetical protein
VAIRKRPTGFIPEFMPDTAPVLSARCGLPAAVGNRTVSVRHPFAQITRGQKR